MKLAQTNFLKPIKKFIDYKKTRTTLMDLRKKSMLGGAFRLVIHMIFIKEYSRTSALLDAFCFDEYFYVQSW